LLFTSLNVLAQETWSVNECIRYATENNLNHKNHELGLKNDKIEALQSKMNLLPSIFASTSGGMSYGRSVDNSTNSYTDTEHFSMNGRIGANLALFQGFSKLNRIAYTRFRLQSSEWNLINDADDLAFDILNTYYNVVFYSGLVTIAQDQLEISEYNLKKTQAQVQIGLQAKSDLLQMQAALEKEKLEIILAQNKVEEVKFSLLEQMNYKLNNVQAFIIDYTVNTTPFALQAQSDSLFITFKEKSPLLKKGEAELNAAKKNVAIAKGNYMPSLSLNASLGTRYSDTSIDFDGDLISIDNQINNNLNKYVGATLSIPIFNRNQYRTRVKQAKINHDVAQNAYEEKKQSLYFQIANDARKLRALRIKYIQTEKKLEADNLAYKAALKKYIEGLINVIELLTVKDQLSDSKSQLLLAKIQYEVKSRTIEFYKGNRFWE